jgi:hypothetical protein
VKQAEMLDALVKLKKEYHDKYNLYHDIHKVIERACGFCIHDHPILSEHEDLLRYLRKKKNENEVEGKIHDRLVGIFMHLHPEGIEMSQNEKHHHKDDGVNETHKSDKST